MIPYHFVMLCRRDGFPVPLTEDGGVALFSTEGAAEERAEWEVGAGYFEEYQIYPWNFEVVP